MGERLEGHFAVSLFHIYGNINSVFHSNKISPDSKYLSRFVSEMI